MKKNPSISAADFAAYMMIALCFIFIAGSIVIIANDAGITGFAVLNDSNATNETYTLPVEPVNETNSTLNSTVGSPNATIVVNETNTTQINETNTSTENNTIPLNETSTTTINETGGGYGTTGGDGGESQYGISSLPNCTITACGQTITSSCQLNKSWNCAGQAGISIGADNVILDCAGYVLTGSRTYWRFGINMSGIHNNITIKNCIVSNFYRNIFIEDSHYSSFINNTVNQSDFQGIRLGNVSHTLFENNTMFYNDQYGVYWEYSTNNTIRGNTANDSITSGGFDFYEIGNSLIELNDIYGNGDSNFDYGLELISCGNNTIRRNVFNGNYGEGVYFTDSSNSNITDNAIYFSRYGIEGDNSNNARIVNNTIINNTFEGMYFSWAIDNSIIANNTIINSTDVGIDLESSQNATISGNYIFNMDADLDYYGGLYFYDVFYSNITNNTIANSSSGIYLEDSGNNIIMNNMLVNNTYSGVEITGASADNLIYNNYFSNMYNAWDDSGNANLWNISKTAGTSIIGGPYLGGNFWSDYSGLDLSGDWIGDTEIPYNSSNDIQNGGDYLPLAPPYDPCNYYIDSCNSSGWPANKVVCLNTSLTSVAQDCMVIDADNVTFDCRGLFINGSDTPVWTDEYEAVRANGRFNITVKNCRIYDMTYGIFLDGTNYSVIENNTASSGYRGIQIENSKLNRIEDNTCGYNSDYIGAGSPSAGIYIETTSPSNSVINCTTNYNDRGIYVNSRLNNISGHNSSNNEDVGISVNEGDNNTFTGFYIDNSTAGIYLLNADNNTFSGCKVYNGTGNGFDISTSGTNNKITGCWFIGNNYGIRFRTAGNIAYNNYLNNTINARDDGNANTWNTTRQAGTNIIGWNWIGGNFWSDYSGVDDGSGGRPAGDYIGDTLIPHNSSNYLTGGGDYLPLVYTTTTNNAPVIANIVLNSSEGTNYSTENLTLWAKATDDDHDNITYYVDWHKGTAGWANTSFIHHHDRGSFGIDSVGRDVEVDSGGNIYITGYSDLNGDFDFLTFKLNSSGSQIWNNSFHRSSTGLEDRALGIDVDSSGNVYIAGVSDMADRVFTVVKINSSGSTIWNYTIESHGHSEANDIEVDPAGNIYVVGYAFNLTGQHGYADLLLVKLNSSGHQIWNASYGSGDYDYGKGIALDSYGNIYVTGESEKPGVGTEKFLTARKYSSSGNLVWAYSLSRPGKDDRGIDIAVDSARNSYIISESDGASTEDFMVIKLDRDGNYQWNATHDSGTNDYPTSIAVDSSWNIFAAGASGTEYYAVKFNKDGVYQWNWTVPGIMWGDQAFGIDTDNSYVYITGGYAIAPIRSEYRTYKLYENYTYTLNRTFHTENYTENTLVLADTLGSGNTTAGEKWKACITPNDKTVNGTESCSAPMKIFYTEFACDYTLTSCNSSGWPENRTVCLGQDLSSVSQTCMNIDADNVIFDCQSYKINGTYAKNSIGILANNRNNVTIQNCKVYRFDYGIRIDYTNNSRVLDNIANYNNITGIGVIGDSFNNNLSGNTASYGVGTQYATSGEGISVASNNTFLEFNTAENNQNTGFRIGGSHTTLINNIANNNGMDGFLCPSGSSNNIFINNNAENNSRHGIFSLKGNSMVISGNTVTLSGNSGIFASDEYGEIIYNYTISNNTLVNNSYGMRVSTLHNSTISSNSIYNSTYYGIDIDDSENNNITGNTIARNRYDGIYADTLTGNRIYSNNISGNGWGSGVFYMGIEFIGSRGNDIFNNTMHNNSNDAIYFLSGGNNHNIIRNNSLSYNGYWGIHFSNLDGHTNNTIANNTIVGNGDSGIRFRDNFTNNRIYNNNISDNEYVGIVNLNVYDIGAENNLVYNNIIINHSQNAIYFHKNATNNSIYSNTIRDCDENAIAFDDNGDENSIYNNNISKVQWDGIWFDSYADNNRIYSNWINGSVQYSGIEFNDYCTGNEVYENTLDYHNYNGIYFDNYASSNTIRDNIINNSQDYHGIWINLYSDNNTISGNTIQNVYNRGIGIYNVSSNNRIYNNHISLTGGNAISFYPHSYDNLVYQNIIEKPGWTGIVIDANSSGFRVYSNIINNSEANSIWIGDLENGLIYSNNMTNVSRWEGIYFNGVSNNNSYYDNLIDEATEVGIWLTESYNDRILGNIIKNIADYDAIYIDYGENASIKDNTLVYNYESGIWIDDGKSINISGNNISHNEYSGISIDDSSQNIRIWDNYIINNTNVGLELIGTSNTGCTVYNNFFNNSININDTSATNDYNTTYSCTRGSYNIIGTYCIGGNYWPTYTGKDTNGDGIGDTLVPFNESANILGPGDYLPLNYLNDSSLAVWDDPDAMGGSITRYAEEQVYFFANYTDPNSSRYLIGECWINFSDQSGDMRHYEVNSTHTFASYPEFRIKDQSMELDSNDYPHIVYFDTENNTLNYMKWNGTDWDNTVLDEKNDGGGASIALDPNDYPHISYLWYNQSSGNSRMMHAYWNGTEWNKTTVDNNSWSENSIGVNSTGTPHIVYYHYVGPSGKNLTLARWNGTGWRKDFIDNSTIGSIIPDIEIDSNDDIHVAYTNYVSGSRMLKYAKWNGAGFDVENTGAGSCVYISMKINPFTNYPMISHMGSVGTYGLVFTEFTGMFWDSELIDSEAWNVIGDYSSLDLDSEGNPHITYQDRDNSYVKYATPGSGEAWDIWVIADTTPSGGFGYDEYSSLRLDSYGYPHLLYSNPGANTTNYFKTEFRKYIYNRTFSRKGDYPYSISCEKWHFMPNTEPGSVHITNSHPVPQPSIYARYGGYWNEDLYCTVTTTDLDEDLIDYRGSWYKNGVEYLLVWNKTEDSGSQDLGWDVAIDSQDNMVTAASVNPAGDQYMWILKYDSNGNGIWGITVDKSDDEEAFGIAVDSEDNIIVTGYTYSFGSAWGDVWTIKYNSSGYELWNVTAGRPADIEGGQSVAIDSNDNIYIGGHTNLTGNGGRDYWLLKYYPNGTQAWNVTTGRSGTDFARGVAVDSNDDIILVGETNSFGAGGYDIWTIKYNSSGAELWNKTAGGTQEEAGYEVEVDSDDNIIVTGYTKSFGAGNEDVWIIKYNSSGSQIWNATEGGTAFDHGWDIDVDSRDNIIVSGRTSSFGAGGADSWMIKYNSSGTKLWDRTFGTSNFDLSTSVAVNSKDDIIGFGHGISNDLLILKYYGFNAENESSSTPKNLSIMPNRFTFIGDNWTCEVRAYDYENYSSFTQAPNKEILEEHIGNPAWVSPASGYSAAKGGSFTATARIGCIGPPMLNCTGIIATLDPQVKVTGYKYKTDDIITAVSGGVGEHNVTYTNSTDNSTRALNQTAPLDSPYDVDIREDGHFVVVDPGLSSGPAAVYLLNYTDNSLSVLNSSDLGAPWDLVNGIYPLGIAIDQKGDYIIAGGDFVSGYPVLWRLNATTNAVEEIASTTFPQSLFIFGVDVDSANDYIVAGGSVSDFAVEAFIAKVDSSTGSVTLINSSNTGGDSLDYPTGVKVDRNGDYIVADYGSQLVLKVGHATKKISTITASISDPFGVSIDSNGNYIVSDEAGKKIHKIDKDTNQSSVISSGLPNFPYGLEVIIVNTTAASEPETNSTFIKSINISPSRPGKGSSTVCRAYVNTSLNITSVYFNITQPNAQVLQLGNGTPNANRTYWTSQAFTPTQFGTHVCRAIAVNSTNSSFATKSFAVGDAGVLPMSSGVPFYTTTQNPTNGTFLSCLNKLAGGSTCDVSWTVHTTGDIGTSWQLFAYFEGSYEETGKATVNIVQPAGGGGGGGGEEPPPCTNECSSGAKRCIGNGVQTCGNYDSDPCTEWGGSTTQCGLGKLCTAGQCINCNTCPSAGTMQCSGKNVQECAYSGNCLAWTTIDTCAEDCIGGVCTCSDECEGDECDGNSIIKCKDIDFDGCNELDTANPKPCATGETCSAGNCIAVEAPLEIEEGILTEEEQQEIIREIIEKVSEAPVEIGKSPSGGGCTGIIERESTTSLSIEKVPITEAIQIPKGFEIIKEPFNIDCQGDTFILTLNIPSNYKDIRALRCRAGECQREIYTTTEKQFACGIEVSINVTEEKRYIAPAEMELIESEEKSITEADRKIEIGANSIEFLQPLPEPLLASISSPKSAVPKPNNPSLDIIGTPLSVKITAEAESLSAIITMPYTLAKGIDEESVAIYVANKERTKWEILESQINREKRTVTAKIENIMPYLNTNSRAAFAAIAISMPYAEASILENVYRHPGSRDAIILVHGLGSSPETFEDMISEFMFNQQPWQIWTFGYSSSRNIDDVARELRNSIETNAMEFDNIYIAAHSLGGIITQEALHEADLDRNRYSFISKVRKVILLGTPNEGSPGAEVYKNLYKYLINFKGKGGIFNVNSNVIEELAKGRIIPRVKGVEYYVIAGTKPYEFNIGLFRIRTGELFEFAEKNDGIVGVSSAQNIGGEYVSDMCKDYWEINVTHTEIIDVEPAVKVIQQILSDSIAEAHQDIALLGRNQYFKLRVDQCNPLDTYVLVGRKIRKEETYDELLCGCGNGYCGEGENEYNCPSDCARILTAEKILISGPLIIYAFLILTFLLAIAYTAKKYVFLAAAGKRWIEAIAVFLFIDISATALYSINYGTHLTLAYLSEAFLVAYIAVLEIWARKTEYHKVAGIRRAAHEIAESEHHFRRFNQGAADFALMAFRPIIRAERRIKRMFHREFADNIRDINAAIEEINKTEKIGESLKMAPYKTVEDLKKSRISRKFGREFGEDIDELKARLDRIKRME